jgi:hypothetical protein
MSPASISSASDSATSVTVERRRQSRIGAVPRRRHAKDDDSGQRDAERAKQYREVHGNDGFVGDRVGGYDAEDGLQGDERKTQSNRQRREGQQ